MYLFCTVASSDFSLGIWITLEITRYQFRMLSEDLVSFPTSIHLRKKNEHIPLLRACFGFQENIEKHLPSTSVRAGCTLELNNAK